MHARSKRPLALAVALILLGATACSGGSRTGATGSSAPPASSPGDIGGLVPYGAPIAPAVSPTGTATDGTLTTPDGRARTYRLYVPPALPAGQDVPLLVALHGGFGWGEQLEANSGFDGLADANDFIVVYPDGIPIPATAHGQVWNAGGCCGPAQADKQDVDDVGFLTALVANLEQTEPIDAHRVYAAGHSNGAMMSYRLACERADTFAAIGVQSGTLFTDPCQPSRAIPVLEIHGSADTNVPLDGGRGSNVVAGYTFPSPVAGLEHLAAAGGCPSTPTVTTDPANADVRFSTWAPCTDGAVVELATVASASHAWMGHASASPRLDALAGSPYLAFDSSAAIWSFVSAFRLP